MSSSTWILRWGSLAPRAAISWPIYRTASSTVQDHTWSFLGGISPVLYLHVKALMFCTGSLYENSGDSRAMSLYKLSHFTQFPPAVVAMILEIPFSVLSDVVQNISYKQLGLVGSTSCRTDYCCSFVPYGKVWWCRWGLWILRRVRISHYQWQSQSHDG